MGELTEKLLSYHVLLMAIAAWIVLWSIRKIWSGMDGNKWVRKFKPLYAAALCEGFVFIPGVLPDAVPGEKVLIALWSGFLAAIGYQLLRRFVKVKTGVELPENPDELGPGGGSPEEEKPAVVTAVISDPDDGDTDDD